MPLVFIPSVQANVVIQWQKIHISFSDLSYKDFGMKMNSHINRLTVA